MARQADITNLASVEAMTSEAIARFRRIDILVNNAGNAGPSDPNISPKPFWETSPAEWEPFIAPNSKGVMNCSNAVRPSMTHHSEIGRAPGRAMVGHDGSLWVVACSLKKKE